MAAQPLDSRDSSVQRVHPITRSAASARKHLLRPRLVALAPTVAGVVYSAGGWLFDRVMAGWDVTVLVADPAQTRPLDILGVRVVDLESGLATKQRDPKPQALALDTQLCASDARIRDGLFRVFEQELAAEVTLWGDGSTELGRPIDSVRHHLSFAAQAFKAQALAALAEPAHVETAELFHSCGLSADCSGFRDLVPMS